MADIEYKTYYILMGVSLPRYVGEAPDDVVAFHEEHPYPMAGNVIIMTEYGEIQRTVGVSTLCNEVQDRWAREASE